MKWPFWRRKTRPAEVHTSAAATATALLPARHAREDDVAASEPLAPLLAFARDYLVASGAQVRLAAADLLTAVMPDGARVRYTASPARAAADAHDVELLIEGGAALAEMTARAAEQGRLVSLRLEPTGDPVQLARSALAAPAPDCLHCTREMGSGGDGRDASRCDRCPAREGRLVLDGAGAIRDARVLRRWDAAQMELSYRIDTSDRQGRREEWPRLAVDVATGADVPVLAPPYLARATDADDALDAEAIAHVLDLGAARVASVAGATAAFARLRWMDEYRRQWDDVTSAHARLRRESPTAAGQIDAALAQERERLRELFAVDVTAEMESAAALTVPMAEVLVRFAGGAELALAVDLGRAWVAPPACARCGARRASGRLCPNGHVTCAACTADADGDACAACASGATPQPDPPARDERAGDEGELTVDVLDRMTDATWESFVAWLLEQDGVRVERQVRGGAAVWHGQRGDGEAPVIALAPRLPVGWWLGEVEVRQAAAHLAGDPAGACLLITPAEATAAAYELAPRLHVELWARAELRAWLSQRHTHYDRERTAEQREAERRAATAAAARDAIVAALTALEQALAGAINRRRAVGATTIATHAAAITAALSDARRALAAWDTLAGEWAAAFAEREARDGSLMIVASVEALSEMEERAAHLRAAALDALDRLARTPGTGEHGYTTWRKAVVEELTARCEALRWRTLAMDPARWRAFRDAQDAQALARAETSATAAGHAAARAQKAYAQLAARARLPEA
ncbi:MAG TPA: restriction endonuclease [Ktedonobacterales bacterium]|nr:restriction endonuclease [Ktedonobacterales bacterium]